MQIGLSLSLTAQLRSSSTYAVLGYDPALVFDFKGNYFRKIATASTFGASITHAASTNATMVDSDGLLKWRPHNLMTSSQDFTTSNWSKTNLTFVANATTAPDGTLTADKIIEGSGLTRGRAQQAVAGVGRTLAVYAKAAEWDHVALAITNGSGYWAVKTFNLTSGTLAGGANYGGGVLVENPTITSVGDGWYLCTVDITAGAGAAPQAAIMPFNQSGDPVNPSPSLVGDGTSGIYVWGAHTYQSDLGGMVNNPDASTGFESYVPTTTTRVYLSRRGHHIYNGSAWVNEGILHESEARTNLLTYSNDFTNAAWSKTNLTLTANQATGPDGTVSAAEIGIIIGHAATSYCINSTASTTGTLSYFAKQNTERFLVIVRGSYGAGDWAIFDLSNGTVSTSPTHTDSTAHITPMGNGWYRCVLQSAQSATVNAFAISGSGTSLYATTSGTVYIYGAQMEAGSTPSSYIPTTTATVTRAAETLTVPAANLPYDSTNMSIQIDGKMTYADTGATFEVQQYRWQLNSVNYIYSNISTVTTRAGQPTFWQRQSTSGQGIVSGAINAYSPDTNVPFNRASRHGSTFINGAHEGTLLTANTTPTILPDLSATDLELGQLFMGTIGQFRMWSDDLGDVGITEAST